MADEKRAPHSFKGPRPTADADEAASHLGQEDADRKKKDEPAPQRGASKASRQPGGAPSGSAKKSSL